MVRRRMTVKRLDPWSVLKFGAVANIVLYAILMIVAGIIWFIVDRLQLVDQVCGIATDVGFTSCGINANNLFRALGLLGGMAIIVQTAVLVFFAFLYNLIADLTGGLSIGVVEEGVQTRQVNSSSPVTNASTPPGAVAQQPPRAPARRVMSRSPEDGRRPSGEQLFHDS